MLIQVAINSLASAAAYILVAVGFGLIYSTNRFFHFAHGAVYTIGAYSAYTATVYLGFDWWFGLSCAVFVAGTLGGLLEAFIYRRMRHAGTTPTILFLSSLGLLIVLQNLISLAYGDGALVLRRESATMAYTIWGAIVTRAQLERLLLASIATLLLWGGLRFTRFGRQVRATANDSNLSKIVGVRTDRILLGTFVLGSALAGMAAVMLAHDTGIRPNMGFHVLLIAVVAITVGGVGSVPGTALGALLVAVLQNASIWLFPAQWGDAVAYLFMIVFLLARPCGFLGKSTRAGGAI